MSTPTTNQRLVLHKRPEKGPVTSETFKLEKVDLKPLGPGEVLVRVDYSAIVSSSLRRTL
jgi:NADPH-dependent curcumin reductase CurA